MVKSTLTRTESARDSIPYLLMLLLFLSDVLVLRYPWSRVALPARPYGFVRMERLLYGVQLGHLINNLQPAGTSQFIAPHNSRISQTFQNSPKVPRRPNGLLFGIYFGAMKQRRFFLTQRDGQTDYIFRSRRLDAAVDHQSRPYSR